MRWQSFQLLNIKQTNKTHTMFAGVHGELGQHVRLTSSRHHRHRVCRVASCDVTTPSYQLTLSHHQDVPFEIKVSSLNNACYINTSLQLILIHVTTESCTFRSCRWSVKALFYVFALFVIVWIVWSAPLWMHSWEVSKKHVTSPLYDVKQEHVGRIVQ